jgi:hypothetical protein
MPEDLIMELKPLLGALVLCAGLLLSACASTGSTAQKMPVARTPEQIKGDCWMKYENDPKMTIDKRATLVDQCIAEHQASGVPVN